MNDREKSKETSYECKICGGCALHSNYGAITCSPCKMFFKRNAELAQGIIKCDSDGHCEINIQNRHICSSCRLNKCFTSGMKTQMIRGSRNKKNSIKPKKKINDLTNKVQIHQLPTLNLFQTDQSILTIDQWNLFSNLMDSYDEHSALSLAERFLFEQNILPIKLRFKSRSVMEFLSALFAKVQLLFEKNPNFIGLHSNDRSILLHRQMKYITIISSSFIVQQSHLLDYPAFNKALDTLFGGNVIACRQLMCFDIPFLKLSLGMLCFCSFGYSISDHLPADNLANWKRIEETVDIYIELAWRYLVYVYDDKQVIICFLNLIRCILSVINNVILLKDKKAFTDMINDIIKQTEQSFIVNRK